MAKTDRQILTEKHTAIQSFIFKLKSNGLIVKRSLENIFSLVNRFPQTNHWKNLPIVAVSESQLWNPLDNAENWILTAGKIQNLRVAAQKINGLEIRAGEVFSFWKHVGNPNVGGNYVIGREIREGCIVPTMAGGLCQLSNALYDAALKANLQIVERHRHSKVIKGSLAEQDRDATVKWNYIDLRFKSAFDLRIEVEMNTEKLVVIFKSRQTADLTSEQLTLNQLATHTVNDCYSCGNVACFQHVSLNKVHQSMANTAFILDEKWAEFDEYIANVTIEKDIFIVPIQKSKLIQTTRYQWSIPTKNQVKSLTFETFYRAISLRIAAYRHQNPFELSLKLDEKLAKKAANLIPIHATHLVISQNLLPFLMKTGALAGRTYDVLMTRLPISMIHHHLDLAFSLHSESKTLKDFRTSDELISLENEALNRVNKLITCHAEISAMYPDKTVLLPWHLPKVEKMKPLGNKILFPAAAVGRKGAYEVRRLAKELQLSLVVMGNTIEQDNFWEGVEIERFSGNYAEIGCVIYPTYVENQPRQLLKAMAFDIPILTTTASGLVQNEKVITVPIGDYNTLKQAFVKLYQPEIEIITC